MRLPQPLPLLVALAMLLPSGAFAQSEALVESLGGLAWGMARDEAVEVFTEQFDAQFRTDIAGVNDPIRIDRLRQERDRRVGEIAGSHETFEELRTAYDGSVIAGEVRGRAGQSMITMREALLTRYLIFAGDLLTKVAIVYALDDVGYIGFEAFVERLEQLYGRPTSTEWGEDDLGIRRLQRALWDDGATRLRVEDRSALFAGYVLVFTDATRPDEVVDVAALNSATRPSAGRNLSDMVRRIGDEPQTGRPGSDDIVDQITGSRTEVVLDVREVEDEGEPADGSGEGSALDEDEALEAVERTSRPRPSTPATETDADEGVTIY